MDTYEKILVLFLATTLGIVLVLGIVVLIKVLQVVNHIKHISQRAEEIADKAEAIGNVFHKASGPIILGRFLANMSDVVFNHSKKSDKAKKE